MKITKIFFISFFFVSCATTMYENDLDFDLVENFVKKNMSNIINYDEALSKSSNQIQNKILNFMVKNIIKTKRFFFN